VPFPNAEVEADFSRAFKMAGYSAADFGISVPSSDADAVSMARAYIDRGARVLVMSPRNTTVGKEIQALAAQHGVALISYDRPLFQGSGTYYAGFDNIGVGKLMGDSFRQCVKDWRVSKPKVFELSGGSDIDPNAISFALGYNESLWGKSSTPLPAGTTNDAGYLLVGEQNAPGWDPQMGATIFGTALAAHPEISAILAANDALAGSVITALRAKGVPARKVPTVGQDATLTGLANILRGYQCGTVYKPSYLPAQAAVALATFLRAGQKPPASLLNGEAGDPAGSGVTVPAVLLTGTVWVDAHNMPSTVIKDGRVSASELCAAVGPGVCSSVGITP
jgi:D-xylose transport system substrate-binding protein